MLKALTDTQTASKIESICYPVYEASGKLENEKMQFCKTYNLANGNLIGTFAVLLGMMLLFCMAARAAEADALATNKELLAIKMIPGDGMNLAIEEVLNPYYVIVKVNPSVHNWFAGTFTNLPKDKDVTIGLSMEGMDTPGNKADVTKWRGLMPVMTYADPEKYETYEWFQKDNEGRWVSGDPFKLGEKRFAGTGKTPEQSVIPKEIAEDYLSKDGTYWQAWREVDNAEAVGNLNIFRIKQKFAFATATVAMRVPYTYTYLQQLTERIIAARIPVVTVDEIGTTPEGRKLQVIRLEEPCEDQTKGKLRQTIMVYAREHANEPDGSWAIEGMVRWLLSDDKEAVRQRKQTIFLFIPILLPDASVKSLFNEADIFQDIRPIMPEVISYSTWVVNWLDKGYRLDVTVDLHNVECNEGQNLMCPFVNNTRLNTTQQFNTNLFNSVTNAGYSVGDPKGWERGIMGLRFYGWCFRRFRSFDLAFEFNSRYPQHILSIAETCGLGQSLIQGIGAFTVSKDFDPVRQSIDVYMTQRTKERNDWWAMKKRTPETRNTFDLLVKGY